MEHGVPRLLPAAATSYPIIGQREDLPFTTCRSSSTDDCETMMVHKFTTACGGQKVAWEKIAASAPSVGVALPEHLPAGFAPVSRFRGRFVLPGFGRTTHLPSVAKQSLSADSVIETGTIERRPESPRWVTMVDPSITASQGGAFKVAGVVSLLLVSLMAGCLFVARRRIPIPLDFARSSSVSRTSGSVLDFAKQVYARMTNAVRTPDERSDATRRGSRDNHFATSLAAVHARLVETELLVATLPPDLLLREVLQTELDGLRARGAEASRRAGQLDAKRSGALLRGMIKDLDRITRIVRGTARQEDSELSAGPIDPPSTIFEAYRVLGLNPDAPPAAVKKVVDALRMSWHPDHARSEADRQNREQRIKQINAAWDILKGSRVVAV
jgi:hypothetical protein